MFNSGNLFLTVEQTAGRLLLALVIILVFVAALLRWFSFPIVWSVDMAQLMFVWVNFIGADLAVQKRRHIGVTLLVDKFSPRGRFIVALLTDLASLAFVMTLGYFAAKLAIENPHRRFPGMSISYSWATGSAAVGSLLMIRSFVVRIVQLLRNQAVTTGERVA